MPHFPLLNPMFQNVIDMDLTSTQLLASETLSKADSWAKVAYLAAAVLFVLSLAGLSKQTTARRGNLLGIIGMVIAVCVTIVAMLSAGNAMAVYTMMAVAITAAVVVGAILAARVPMTGMPELVAMLHSFVGLAAVLVGISSHIESYTDVPPGELLIHDIEIFIGVFIGAITFTGSIIAFLKLRGTIGGKPLTLPGRHMINLLMVAACVSLGVWFYRTVLWG